ncbi:hypothetical protein PCYB_104290 [Plasmodium cynomolgi strain B]|uniref:Uncharacterized protein n=1 Tax=Plasmodium cynomolgi (strain B) TaxID=1120755 RepID=K6UUI4_PLACD|nr:hypothetical protein PCYB_104290 [Plasmodium cynomolgi strain B]GAB67079.1 hypothetical protein PCYB_104290 [Plasmodium cynomolgi strain B]
MASLLIITKEIQKKNQIHGKGNMQKKHNLYDKPLTSSDLQHNHSSAYLANIETPIITMSNTTRKNTERGNFPIIYTKKCVIFLQKQNRF